jgi:hypothetical protein
VTVTHFEPILAGKLGKLLRLLGSDRDGEVLGAVHALRRTLAQAGLDLHALVAGIEGNGAGRYTEADALEIYRRGVADGRAEAQSERISDFTNVDGSLDWHEVACWCGERSHRLRPNECQFIADMTARTVWQREPTEKQAKWLLGIYYRLGGKRP